jgi:NitT/TauT family transport system ATP-binding protein
MSPPPALVLDGVGHAYFGRYVLEDVHLRLHAGEVAALLGPSGSGKSTLLAIAAGIVEPLRGTLQRGYRRHAMVFQEPRLLPWASAADNIAYPLRLAGMPRAARAARVAEVAALAHFDAADLDKYPVELSGGMRQRVAIARALAPAPDFVYFDEPFTALDPGLRRAMQDLVIEAAGRHGFGALFVTHDVQEAVRIAHRVLVLDAVGRGLAGERVVPGEPGQRDARTVFETAHRWLTGDALFREVERSEERTAGWQ